MSAQLPKASVLEFLQKFLWNSFFFLKNNIYKAFKCWKKKNSSCTYWEFKISMRHHRPQHKPIIMSDSGIHSLTLTYGNLILFCDSANKLNKSVFKRVYILWPKSVFKRAYILWPIYLNSFLLSFQNGIFTTTAKIGVQNKMLCKRLWLENEQK